MSQSSLNLMEPDDIERVSVAVRNAEVLTSGEIFCVLARQASSYRDICLIWALAAGFLLPLVLMPLGFEAAWTKVSSDVLGSAWQGSPWRGTQWLAAQSGVADLAAARTLTIHAFLQLAVFLFVFALTGCPPLRRLVVPASVRRTRVRRAALGQFLAHGVHMTQGRTGVLIFAALSERQVEIIADQSIHDRVDSLVWARAVQDLTTCLRQGQAANGFEAAIKRVGSVLAEHFPPHSPNIDELPNRLVQM